MIGVTYAFNPAMYAYHSREAANIGRLQLKTTTKRQTISASVLLTKTWVRAAAVASIVATFSVGLVEPVGFGLAGGSGLAAFLATPAHARCLLNGAIRNDIAEGDDCLEAQRTGCVQHMLTHQQYTRCLADNKRVQTNGQACIIGGTIHNELNARQCEEAQGTGCVRELLTHNQYVACLNAQRH